MVRVHAHHALWIILVGKTSLENIVIAPWRFSPNLQFSVLSPAFRISLRVYTRYCGELDGPSRDNSSPELLNITEAIC